MAANAIATNLGCSTVISFHHRRIFALPLYFLYRHHNHDRRIVALPFAPLFRRRQLIHRCRIVHRYHIFHRRRIAHRRRIVPPPLF
jgi:hypothetical protein